MDASAPFDPAKSSMAQTCFSEEGLGGFSPNPPRIARESLESFISSLISKISTRKIREARKSTLAESIIRILEGDDWLNPLAYEDIEWQLEIDGEDILREETAEEDWAAYSEAVLQKNRGVLYGASYDEGPPSEEDSGQSQSSEERRQFFASLGSVGELKDFLFNIKLVVNSVVSRRTSTGFLNISVSEEFRSSLLDALNSRKWEEVESMVMPIAAALPRRAAIYEAFIVLASLLLSAIFQYLMALVDKGGTKTDSSGSRGFRSRYTCTVLFLGAYVWIKFREVAPPSQQKPSPGICRKFKVNDLGVKVYYGNYEPRFKPQGSHNSVYVGLYEEEEDARIIYQILAFYYGRAVPGELPLLNGSSYRIPCMTEEEQRLDPESKKEWAKGKAKVVLEEFKRAWSNSILLASLPDPEEVEAAGYVSNIHPPDAGVGCDGQLGNHTDGSYVPVRSRCSSPNLGPGTHVHVAVDPVHDHVAAAGAGVSDDPPTEPALEEWLACFNPDAQEVQGTGDISSSFVPYAQADFQLGNRSDGLDIAVPPSNSVPNVGPAIPIPVAAPLLEPHVQHHALEENQANHVNPDDPSVTRLLKEVLRQQQLQQYQIHQLEFENQQLGIRNSVLERHQQVQGFQMQQQQSRISELEGEVELLRSTEPARKRICVGLSMRHDTQS